MVHCPPPLPPLTTTNCFCLRPVHPSNFPAPCRCPNRSLERPVASYFTHLKPGLIRDTGQAQTHIHSTPAGSGSNALVKLGISDNLAAAERLVLREQKWLPGCQMHRMQSSMGALEKNRDAVWKLVLTLFELGPNGSQSTCHEVPRDIGKDS